MPQTLSLTLSHVQLVADDPKDRRRYQFDDLEQKSRKSRYKSKTEFRTELNVGDHAVLFTLTDWVHRHSVKTTQNHSIVISDLTHAKNYYNWLVRHNPDINVDIQWTGKLTVL